MNRLISLRDVQEMVRNGQHLGSLPAEAILTPSARDFLNEVASNGAPASLTPAPAAAPVSTGKPMPPAKPLTSKSPKSELEAFFHSAYALDLRQQICEMGRRLWQRAYVDGNGGNMAIRVGEDIAICTPTLVSKGSLKPEDMCLVDFEGNQLLGTKKRTSEILMHLQIMQKQPKAIASCHCHPPYATGFAVAGIVPPTCMIPEYEVFASVALAPYRTPGTPEMGKLVADLADKHNTILMANHGVVTWSHNGIEEAYWRMEIIEAYCRTLLVTAQLGKAPNTFTPAQLYKIPPSFVATRAVGERWESVLIAAKSAWHAIESAQHTALASVKSTARFFIPFSSTVWRDTVTHRICPSAGTAPFVMRLPCPMSG